MAVKVTESLDVRARANELGCELSADITLLPINFDTASTVDALLDADTTPTIRSLWRQAGLNVAKLNPQGYDIPEQHKKFFEWAGPVVFISSSLISQNPYAVPLALNVLGNYLTDFFKGIPGIHIIKLEVILEKDQSKGTTRTSYKYEGNLDGLRELIAVISSSIKETRDGGV